MPPVNPIAGESNSRTRAASEWVCFHPNCVDMVKLAVITFRPIVKFRTNQAARVYLRA